MATEAFGTTPYAPMQVSPSLLLYGKRRNGKSWKKFWLEVQILFPLQLRSRRGGAGAQGRSDAAVPGRDFQLPAAQRRVEEDRLGRPPHRLQASALSDVSRI